MYRAETVPFRNIIDARRSSYSKHASKHGYYSERNLEIYENELPKFKGRNVSRLIEDKIAQGAKVINVLDIGCGKGIFLANLVQTYPQVRTFGISAFDYKDGSARLSKYIKQVDYRIGDAQRLAKAFPDVKFDVVVSRHCLQYVADPLSVLRQAYRKSQVGGVILLDKLGTQLTQKQVKSLQALWKQSGIQAELSKYVPGIDSGYPLMYGLAMQKASNQRLPLPFNYSFYETRYSFDEEAVSKTVTKATV